MAQQNHNNAFSGQSVQLGAAADFGPLAYPIIQIQRLQGHHTITSPFSSYHIPPIVIPLGLFRLAGGPFSLPLLLLFLLLLLPTSFFFYLSTLGDCKA